MDNQEEKDRAGRKIFARLQARERLKALADNPDPKTREEVEVDRLRAYLRMWATGQSAAYGTRETADSSLSHYMKPSSPEAAELLEQSDGWAMAVVDASIDDLVAIPPEGALMRAALRVRWLNEGLSPEGTIQIRVFRSGRLQPLTVSEADRLADQAEKALIPIAKRRGLPL